ncbi:hypothetical protein SO802_013488 [Lithocarpus litseifolius]|uniref:CRIB domain-containing protein n=1 Tax=Lithocarpus litseifolius TaxID=425828 RepID=A0AAW2D7Y2_9ROSI
MEGVETIFNRPTRAMEESTGAVSSVTLDNREFTQAHRYVLFNSENIFQFRDMVEDELRRGHRHIFDAIIEKHHMEKFYGWFKSHVMSMTDANRERTSVTDTIITLSKGLSSNVEANRKTQNSGVSVATKGGISYYGVLTDIIKLNYSGNIRHMLFKCTWVDDQNRRGYKNDEIGFPMVNFTHSIHGGEELVDELYVLASQATQVFYVEDKRQKDWYVVVKTKARDVFDAGIGPHCDEDDTYGFYENIPYSITSNDAGRENLRWGRDDVEGMTIDASIIRERDLHEMDNLDDCEFIDDESNDEDDNEVEYNDDE